jgi:hypothetical protein
MADSNANTANIEVLRSLFDGGLGALFEDKEVCAYFKEGLKEAGCRPPFHIIVFTLLRKLALLGWDFGGQTLRSRLLDLLARNQRVSRWLDRIANICRECEDKNRLKDIMLAHLRGDRIGGPGPKVDDATDEAVLRQLYTKDRFDQQDKQFDAIAAAFQDLLVEKSGDRIAPHLGWAKGSHLTIADSIRYNSGLYGFVGRERELDLLDRFCGDLSMAAPGNRFSWLLLTGPGGEGKTRLALEFTTQRIGANWKAGRLSLQDLRQFRYGEWLPAKPTMIVIDYPAQGPDEVHALLANLARRHLAFDWPVRVLLLEREAGGEWFDRVSPSTGDGAAIRDCVFAQEGEPLLTGMRVRPIETPEIVAMMESRFRTAGFAPPPPEQLLNAVFKADSRRSESNRSPRPLFAAAVTEVMIAALGRGEKIDTSWIDALARADVLGDIIKRDREAQWMPCAESQQVLEQHENLVALATLAAGVKRSDLHELLSEIAGLFPDPRGTGDRPLREELIQRMSGYNDGRIAPLEPDLLGEYFLLDRLERIEEVAGKEARHRFCAIAFELGRGEMEGVVLRTTIDFTDRVEKLDWLFAGADVSLPPALATSLDIHFTAAEDFARRERLRQSLAKVRAFAKNVVRSNNLITSHWLRLDRFARAISEAMHTALDDGSLQLERLSMGELAGLATMPYRDTPSANWVERFFLEVKRRLEGDEVSAVDVKLGTLTELRGWMASLLARRSMSLESIKDMMSTIDRSIEKASKSLGEEKIGTIMNLLSMTDECHRGIRDLAWAEIRARCDSDPTFFDTLGGQVNAELLGYAKRDRIEDLLEQVNSTLDSFVADSGSGGFQILAGLLGVQRFPERAPSAAQAIADMLDHGVYPMEKVSFQQVIDTNAILKLYNQDAAVAGLKAELNARSRRKLILDAAHLPGDSLGVAMYEFRDCPAFIDQLLKEIRDHLTGLVGDQFPLPIRALAAFAKIIRRHLPDLQDEFHALLLERRESLVAAIRRSTISDLAYAARQDSMLINAELVATLDQAEWDRRKRLPAKSLLYGGTLAYVLMRGGASAFGGALAEGLARRNHRHDLGFASRRGRTNWLPPRLFQEMSRIAACCRNEKIARNYLRQRQHDLWLAYAHSPFDTLATGVSSLWPFDRTILAWPEWLWPALLVRLQKHLRGQDEDVDNENEIRFIRLLGAVSILLGDDALAHPLQGYAKRIGLGERASIQVLPHRKEATQVESHQLEFWLGLRFLDRFGGAPVNLNADLLRLTGNLLEANVTTPTDSVNESVARELLEWIEQKLGAGEN